MEEVGSVIRQKNVRPYNVSNNGEKENELRTENNNFTLENLQEKVSIVDAATIHQGQTFKVVRKRLQ